MPTTVGSTRVAATGVLLLLLGGETAAQPLWRGVVVTPEHGNEREHFAAKLVSSHGRLDLTSYLSYDSIHEDVGSGLNVPTTRGGCMRRRPVDPTNRSPAAF